MQNENKILYPYSKDDKWNVEVEKILPYLSGKGVDVGAGGRSIFDSDIRVDIDEKNNPDVCCSADKLPFKDGEFDYLYAIHSFEHFENQEETIKEWVRVVRSGGIIAIIHPDVSYTGPQPSEEYNDDKNPYNKHTYERNYKEFLRYLKVNNYFGLRLIDSGPALINWSFYVILKKNGLS